MFSLRTGLLLRRPPACSLFLALALSLSSCSWETEFVVINATQSPPHALRLVRLGSYSRPDLDSWADFPIDEIEVRTAKGSVHYCGTSLLLAFGGSRFRQELRVTGTPRQIRSSTC